MSEAKEFCPHCGTTLEPTAAVCPACGTARDGTKPKLTLAGALKAHSFAIGGGVVAIVAIAAFAVFGGLFGPSGKTICTATLTQARDFGVISPAAVLDSSSAKSTDVKNRKACTAKVGDDTYTMVVDIKSEDLEHRHCRDFVKQPGCIALYSVARSDGMTTYQVREIPPDQTDEALAKSGALATPPVPTAQQTDQAQNAAPAAGDSGGGLDAETAVDNSGSMSNGQQSQPAPQQQAPQQ